MTAFSGMEKFAHLEDKIYRTIEIVQKLREEKDSLQHEVSELKNAQSSLSSEISDETAKLKELMSERLLIQKKVDEMLDALSRIDPSIAEAAAR